MKKYILPFIAIAVFISACGPTQDDAVKLNDQLVAAQKACLKAEEEFYDVCSALNPDEIKTAYEHLKKEVLACAEKAEKAEAHKDFDMYKRSAVKLINGYRNMVDKEFAEYAKLYSISSEDFTEADEVRSGEVADIINTTLNPLNENFVMEQKIFAKQWDFVLTKTGD